MTNVPFLTTRPSFLRRAFGTAALFAVGIRMIVLGMLLVLTIVTVDTFERRAGERQP